MTKSIILIDDDVDLVEAMSDYLEKIGKWQTVCCHSYEDLIKNSLAVFNCQVALLDVNLGSDQPSGLDCYQWLRRNNYSGSIFFLTGHAKSHPLVAEAIRLGDAKVLCKPINPDLLLSTLENGIHDEVNVY